MAEGRASERSALGGRVHRVDGRCRRTNFGDCAGARCIAGHRRCVPCRSAVRGAGGRNHVNRERRPWRRGRAVGDRRVDEREGTREIDAGKCERARRRTIRRGHGGCTRCGGRTTGPIPMARTGSRRALRPMPARASARHGRRTSIGSSVTLVERGGASLVAHTPRTPSWRWPPRARASRSRYG